MSVLSCPNSTRAGPFSLPESFLHFQGVPLIPPFHKGGQEELNGPEHEGVLRAAPRQSCTNLIEVGVKEYDRQENTTD